MRGEIFGKLPSAYVFPLYYHLECSLCFNFYFLIGLYISFEICLVNTHEDMAVLVGFAHVRIRDKG